MDLEEKISEFKQRIWDQLDDERTQKEQSAEMHLQHQENAWEAIKTLQKKLEGDLEAHGAN